MTEGGGDSSPTCTTELRAANERLRRALAEQQATQEQIVRQERLAAIGQMASGIVHDVNNALAMIVGYSELLLAPGTAADGTRLREYLELIHTAAQDAAHVVSRLRELSRERGPAEAPTEVRLHELVEQALALTQPRGSGQAQAEGVTIRVETDLRPLPPLRGQPAELREALINLIFNAVDAMPAGGTLTLRTRDHDHLGIVEVADTGLGMDAEVRQRCFEPFFTTKGERGTGLGLAMVYAVVQRHSGVVSVESAPGRGTTICLSLPVGQAQPAAPAEPAAPDRLPPLRILLVEDEPGLRRLLVLYLTLDGHSVITAANGREGLATFREGRFDLVLTDRAMPELGGDQMAAAIKQIAPNKPVVMLTGFGRLLRADDERPPGVDAVLGKPIKLAELRQALAEATGTSSAWS